jgi:hypothetical protein
MIFQSQIARTPAATLSSFQPAPRSLQRKCACGGTPGPSGECDECKRKRLSLQPKLAVNQPNDRYEQEADRIADQVVPGRAISPPVTPLASGTVQRQESKPVGPKPNNYDEAAKKILEALQETDIGNQLKAKALELGKDFLSSVEGKVIAGSALGGTLAGLIATNSELPMQIPDLPLDFIAPGLKAKITWQGPVRTPTSAGLTLTSKGGVKVSAGYTSTPAAEGKPAEQKGGVSLTIPLGGSTEKPKSKETASEKYRAETARIAAEQHQFREGMKSPEQKAEDKQFWDTYWRMKAKDPLNPLAMPGAGLQSPIEKKKEEPTLQRKASNESNFSSIAPPIVHEVLAEQGQPLDSGTRAVMEGRFGYNFAAVRVHRDSKAAESARAVNAHAYTVGQHLVFDEARYSPDTTEGQKLLAHELTHVVQQSQVSGGAYGGSGQIQRSLKGPTTKPHSCGGWTCAPAGDCSKPDGKAAPNSAASTNWSLTANLDLDVLKAEDIIGPNDVGHAFVEFAESNGDRYTYGHYPGKGGISLPDPVLRPQVPGCTAHPDQTHSECIDMRIAYNLAEAEYKKALAFSQAWCVGGQPYHILTNNCTTFVEEVVKISGKTMPSARGSVARGRLSADNPNTLFDTQVSQADNATWRTRVTGDFTGQYDASGKVVSFTSFELKTDEKFAVAGKYSYMGSTGDKVEGTLDGRLIFNVDAATKAVSPTVQFTWTEPSGSGKGVWVVSATGVLKGTWGRGAADTGGGGWDLSKKP